MFQRASKIVITESSAPNRSHPTVGDTGYLNNMYLFFADRFILLDAFFFRYKSDIKEGKTRCERKKFIIDLGMKKSLKRNLEVYGAPRKFFLENNYVANLTVSRYGVDEEFPRIDSLWHNHHDRAGNNKSKSLVKIPYGQIIPAPDSKKPIQSEGPDALRCWIRCVIPLVENSAVVMLGNDLLDDSLNKTICRLCRRMLPQHVHHIRDDINGPVLALPRSALERLGSEDKRNIIMDMQMVRALSKSLLNNCDAAISDNVFVLRNKLYFSEEWRSYGITRACESTLSGAARALAGLFFRSAIMAGNTEKKLFEMGKNGTIPWSNEMIKNRARKFEDIKRAANFGSAALNRIFEGDLLS